MSGLNFWLRFYHLDSNSSEPRNKLESSVPFSPNSTHAAIFSCAGKACCVSQGFCFNVFAELIKAAYLAL